MNWKKLEHGAFIWGFVCFLFVFDVYLWTISFEYIGLLRVVFVAIAIGVLLQLSDSLRIARGRE